MKYITRIQLEHKKDVIIDVEIPSEKSLKDLHDTIIKSLNLDKNHMASFYITNEEFELIQEIPLFKIDEKDISVLEMSEVTIKSIFSRNEGQLIYVYNFMEMWRFLVSYINTSENISREIKVINTIGKMPQKAPDIIFQAIEKRDSFIDSSENFNEEFNQFNES